MPTSPETHAIVLGGVSGSGKSLIGPMLADRMNARFIDGDDLHPSANKEKMSRREPLTDDDRWPWLERIVEVMRGHRDRNESVVVACSALKPTYRRILTFDPSVRIVLLEVPRDELLRRLGARKGHFFPPELLESQLNTLVPPQPGEAVLAVDAVGGPEEVVERILRQVHSPPATS